MTITGHADTDLTLAPASASLTFTADDWDTAQTVTVEAGEDDDAAGDTETLLHTATGGGYDSVTKDLGVTVTDNDEARLALSKASLGVTEGSSDTYTVKLATQPTAQVTVTITGHADTDLTLAPASASLTFTADDWDTAQTVTVEAGEDGDKNDETVTLQHAATGGSYDSVTRNLAVTVTDDEATVPGAPDLEADAGNESATLRWTPPADNGGSPVTSYKYRLGTSPAENTESMTSHTMHGLANGAEYRFQLQAENRVGLGPWSTAKSVTPRALTLTLEAVSDEVTEGEPVRYRIVMSNPTTSWVTINEAFRYKGAFLRLEPSKTSSWIRFRRDDPEWEKQLATVDDAELEAHGSFTVTLEPGDGYTVGTPSSATVRILDNDGGTAPGAPPRPAVSVVSPTMLDATWGAAAANGAPVTGYALEYRAGTTGPLDRLAECDCAGRPLGAPQGTLAGDRVPGAGAGEERAWRGPVVGAAQRRDGAGHGGDGVGLGGDGNRAVRGRHAGVHGAREAGAGVGAACGPSGDGDAGDALGDAAGVGDGSGGAALGDVRGEDPERPGGRGLQRGDGGAAAERALRAGRGARDVQGA